MSNIRNRRSRFSPKIRASSGQLESRENEYHIEMFCKSRRRCRTRALIIALVVTIAIQTCQVETNATTSQEPTTSLPQNISLSTEKSQPIDQDSSGHKNSANATTLVGHIEAETSNKNNETEANSSSSSYETQQQTAPIKNVPVLRPSLEEVASELSRKHLNLERENWRLKPTSGSALPTQSNSTNVNLTTMLTMTTTATRVEPQQDLTDETEQEINLFSVQVNNETSSTTSVSLAEQQQQSLLKQDTFLKKINEQNRYLHVVETVSTSQPKSRSSSSSRRKKGGIFHHYEDNELHQCHQYLQYHSSQTRDVPVATGSFTNAAHLASLTSNQLPCSCENRRQLINDKDLIGFEEFGIWLSCDNVQLIGSHFYTSSILSNDDKINSNNNRSKSSSGSDSSEKVVMLTRFSQRDSGLQAIHSQKFHYLQLFYLKSIDLSNNRIRQIKMDAFHGLEMRLESLNLANNLLGDSRAVYEETTQSKGSNNNNNNGKLIFLTDELNRLRKLKWLSMRNNYINQLGANIFHKNPSTTTNYDSIILDQSNMPASELVHLDLSENHLKSIPSESINSLNKLQFLDLNNNQIMQLDQFSKFPKSLKYLDLSGNLIKTIRHCDLIDLPNLLELNLSYNQLSQLDKAAFISSSPSPSSLMINNKMSQDSLAPLTNPQFESHDELLQLSFDDGKNSVLDDGKLFENNEAHTSSGDKCSKCKREAVNDQEMEESMKDLGNSDKFEEDLDAEESILSVISNHMNRGQTLSEDLSSIQGKNQFNSTIKLNLSYNFFEEIPGDFLLKFSNLQLLDLSFNRIRHLDHNYLCSVYNLVDNLRVLNLSGNLLFLPQSNTSSTMDNRQLNRVFGCLQKLEQLYLATNRLNTEKQSATSTIQVNDEQEDINNGDATSEQQQNERLMIRIGDGFSSKYLNTLDLSDNRLKVMPIIEQISNHPIVLLNTTNMSLSEQQNQLNQWINSRIYIETLNLGLNNLERLDEQDFEHLFNLRHLHLNLNKLTTLPLNLMRRFTSLDRLLLNGNRISSIDPLNELLERSAKTLRVLNLANNRLLEWPNLSRKLTNYDSSSNQEINNENKRMQLVEFALEELNLEGNLLTSNNVSSLFDQLMHMKSLKVLNLSYNLLNKIKSEWFKFANGNLQRLLLSGNKINTLELGSFAKNQVDELMELNLEYNLLKELKRKTFDSMPKIRELNLGNNLIHTINGETFHQVNSLQILRLNNNKLTSWKCEYFSGLCNSITGNINADLSSLLSYTITSNQDEANSNSVSSLIELDLGYNSLSQLRANSISVHTKLVKLNLEHNKLSFIPQNLFKASTSTSTVGREIQLVSSLKYINLAHNRIQTIDNINFKPLRNLISLDFSFNELQTLGIDIVLMDQKSIEQEQNNRRVIISNNLTNLVVEDEVLNYSNGNNTIRQSRTGRSSSIYPSATNWPPLGKLRHLNLASNQLTMINQSLLNELSPFALLNLNLSSNYLDSEALPYAFYTKIIGSTQTGGQLEGQKVQTNYDLVFTLKLESLDLSHNRLNEFPSNILDNHYTSLEACNLSHNRIRILEANSNVMIQLKHLDLSFNPLSREANELILYEQKSVRYLNLAATRLYAIQQATQSPSYSTLEGNTFASSRLANQTSQLDLIRSISRPIDAPYLRHLNLSSNQLVWLAGNVFERMHSLETLDLSNNQLTRLHLLNNQLSHIHSSLLQLNLASNLFTSIDSTDFSQFQRIRSLDLSNLLSLQKMNCKFLSKLATLRKLRMFNYPLLRQGLNTLMKAINLQATSSQPSDRILRKLQSELVTSTIGNHCFQEDSLLDLNLDDSNTQLTSSSIKWFNLEELELELFNNFANQQQVSQQNGYKLKDDLDHLLGPRLTKLTLVGLNLTSFSDDSFLGLTNDHLQLKISYTSVSQLPLKQILNSIAKRTRLELDFRHNNIRSIDVNNLQLLDELQFGHQRLRIGHDSALRLSYNPFRCDCQTRPLWLWLNQRSGSSDLYQVNDDQVADSTSSTASNLLKINSNPQLSDLKCYYPLKLRGKLAKHVYYSDLVCKGSAGYQQTASSSNRQLKKKNETSETYYVNSETIATELDDLDDEESIDIETKLDAIVKVTRFNRYPSTIMNSSLLLLNTFSVPFIQEKNGVASLEGAIYEEERSRKGRRDGDSANFNSTTSDENTTNVYPHNIRYNKHRPNTQQRHSHFSTLSNFNQMPIGKVFKNPSNAKYSLLTESDVMILTGTSIAMIIMAFVILAICLLKYKMDKSDREHILSPQGKFFIPSHSGLLNDPKLLGAHHRKYANSGSSSNSSSNNSKKQPADQGFAKARKDVIDISKRNPLASSKTATFSHHQPFSSRQILVPMRHTAVLAVPAAQNFLMRSPTIRRMHGLASNASDWFKFTLRPNPTEYRRRRLFTKGVPSTSQLTTTKPIATPADYQSSQAGSEILSVTLASGCPRHGMRSVQRLKEFHRRKETSPTSDCLYCTRLLATLQQTKVQYIASPSDKKKTSSKESLSKTNNLQDDTNQSSSRLKGEVTNRTEVTTSEVSERHEHLSYVTPGLIKALTKQLEQRQEVRHNKSNWKQQQQQHHLAADSGLYHTREQRIKSLKTFGSRGQSFSKPDCSNVQQEVGSGERSELPTVDVDGRFAYQSDSQIESPQNQYQASSIADSRGNLRDGNTPSSFAGTQDIFILMHDSSSIASELQNPNHLTKIECPEHIEIVDSRENETGNNNVDVCSHSSSPVTYGFMRHSPSITTVSSTTINQNQYTINPMEGLTSTVNGRSAQYSLVNDGAFYSNNNLDNTTNYSVVKKKTISVADTQDDDLDIDNDDERIIISRL